MDRALRTAVDQREEMTSALVRSRDDDVGVARIQHDVADTGVVGDLEHLLPCLAAVARLVEPAISAWCPKRALSRYVYDVAVLRAHDDASNVLRVLEPHVLPRPSAVVRLVDAISIGHGPLRIAFAGTRPHHVRVVRIESYPADGV